MTPLTAVILAAGIQSRFWPLTKNKIFYPMGDRPYVAYSVLDCIPEEIEKIVVIASPENACAFDSVPFPKPYTVVIQDHPNGMAGAILTAKNELSNSQLLIMIADHLVKKELLTDIVRRSTQSQAMGILPGWKPEGYFPGGYLILDGNRVCGIKEKPGPENRPSDFVYISGTYIRNSNDLIDTLIQTVSDRDDVFEKALTTMMGSGQFIMEPYTGISLALKYPWDILTAAEYCLGKVQRHTGNNVTIAPSAIIDGNVYLDDGAKVFEHATIKGPAYIGKGSIVGNNALIRQAFVGDNCVVGFHTEIARSLIGNNCWFHSNYIGDSVLEDDIGLGAGAITANFRLDEKPVVSVVKGQYVDTQRTKLGAVIGSHVRIGVNVSLMPGVKIGPKTFISSGLTVVRDIPDNRFVKGIMKTEITENRCDISLTSRKEYKQKV